MFYVTSLDHAKPDAAFDIYVGENPTPEKLQETNLNEANIYYSGHHSDFNRTLDVNGWTAGASATAASVSTQNQVWQGHESMFFAWYDPDGDGAEEAFEIAVKRDKIENVWRIENKVFDIRISHSIKAMLMHSMLVR